MATKLPRSKLVEGKAILKALGLPAKQQSDLAARILMALADVGLNGKWSAAKQREMGVHAMIQFIAVLGKEYAENSRETFRKTALRPLEQAHVVAKNRDDPRRATNSMHNRYCLTEDALLVVQAYGAADFDAKAKAFLEKRGSLLEAYQAARAKHHVPVVVPTGRTINLSPGAHNELEKAVIEEFAPRFAPGSRLLYLGDTAKKDILLEKDALESLGVPCSMHDKFPDVVLHLEEKAWLFLVEAVTTQGPVSPGRLAELKALLKGCHLVPVFVTAFPDFKTFKKYAAEVAWETEVWIKELPDHLIHYNGDKFLGPTSKP